MCVSAVRLFEIRELDERVTINSRSGLEFGNGLGEYVSSKAQGMHDSSPGKLAQKYGLNKQKIK